MSELLGAIYVFWNYTEESRKLVKLWKVFFKYLRFVKWFYKNPEVKIKYSSLIRVKLDNEIIEKIYKSLLKKNKKFSDGFIKEKDSLVFELKNSKLGYRIIRDPINETTQNISFETKFIPFYPLRKFKKLDIITTEFNEIYKIISNPIKIIQDNQSIFVEIEELNTNNEKQNYEKSSAKISFKGNKIQINDYKGTEHGDLLFYFVMKWLTEYKIKSTSQA